MTRSDTPFRWGQDEEAAFQEIKALLTSPPLLRLPDQKQPFIVSTDASAYALGAVLSQIHDNKEYPVAYASRILSPAEKNYSVIEKELLGIVFAMKKFRSYLYGNTFDVFTDHNPLQHLNTMKDAYGRIARWTMFLQDFCFQIKYRKGVDNGNADTLSRLGEICVMEASSTDHDHKEALAGRFEPGSEYFHWKDNIREEGGELWITFEDRKVKVLPKAARNQLVQGVYELGHFCINKIAALLRTMF